MLDFQFDFKPSGFLKDFNQTIIEQLFEVCLKTSSKYSNKQISKQFHFVYKNTPNVKYQHFFWTSFTYLIFGQPCTRFYQ